MVDNLSILLSHALLVYLFYQLMLRNDVDHEGPPPPMENKETPNRHRPIRPGQKRGDPSPAPTKSEPEKPAPVPRYRRAPKPVGRRGDA